MVRLKLGIVHVTSKKSTSSEFDQKAWVSTMEALAEELEGCPPELPAGAD